MPSFRQWDFAGTEEEVDVYNTIRGRKLRYLEIQEIA
jgi:hypothetical protein